MKCPKCGSKTKVWDISHGLEETYRKRKCLICDHRFCTIEYEVENDETFRKEWSEHHRLKNWKNNLEGKSENNNT